MPTHNEGLFYSTIEEFVQWVSENFAGMLSDDNLNSYDSEDPESMTKIKEALVHAEGEVDGYFKIRGYLIPISKDYVRSHNVIRIYVYNIALYELYGRRGITKERYYKYTETIRRLKDFSEGSKSLPDDPPMKGKSVTSGNNLQSTFAGSRREYANNI